MTDEAPEGTRAADDTAEAAEEAAGQGADDAAATAASVPRRRPRLLVAATAVLLVTTVVLAVVVASVQSTLDDERGGRRAVARVAGELGATLFTFDYRRLETHRERVFALSTGRFHREYRQAFDSLRELITVGRTASSGTVQEVFVGDVADDGATAIVVVRTAATGVAGARRSVESYLELTLVRVSGGRWLVDDVVNLNFSSPGESPLGPVPTTTTRPPG